MITNTEKQVMLILCKFNFCGLDHYASHPSLISTELARVKVIILEEIEPFLSLCFATVSMYNCIHFTMMTGAVQSQEP